MKKILFFILFIFLIAKVYAGSLIVSPQEINFELKQEEKVCKNISIEGIGIILIKDKWAEKWEERKELNLHTLNQEDLNIKLDYSKNISINGKEKIKICFSGEEIGKYHGILLFREENSKSGIGIWLNASIKQGEYLNKITGSFTEIDGPKQDISKNILISTFVLLIIIIISLIIIIRKTF